MNLSNTFLHYPNNQLELIKLEVIMTASSKILTLLDDGIVYYFII